MQPSGIVTGTTQILNKLTEWYKVVHSCIISNYCSILAVQNILAYTSETSCGWFLLAHVWWPGINEKKFLAQFIHSCCIYTSFCLLPWSSKWTSFFFFKLKEVATERYERLQLVYGIKLYHLCISENGWEIQRGKWGPWSLCMEWVGVICSKSRNSCESSWAMARDHWVHINQKTVCRILHKDLGKKQLSAQFVLCGLLDELILPWL